MKTVNFWKEIGGYICLVKIKRRWYYVGNTAAENKKFHETAESLGIKLLRQNRPAVLTRANQAHGATLQTVINTFQKWDGCL